MCTAGRNKITIIVKLLNHLLSIFLLILFMMPEAEAASQQHIADSLMNRLKLQTTPQDSIRLLYDVFDSSDHKNKRKIGDMVLDIASRTNNQEALVDFVPQLAVIVKLDSAYDNKLLTLADQIQDVNHRKAIKVFIQVMTAADEANYIPEDELRKVLLHYATETPSNNGDQYDELLDLFRVVIFLGTTSRGNLYLEYLSRLEKMIEKLPKENVYLRNLFYTTAANVHTRNNNPTKAIEADKKLIEVINDLEERYEKMGRKYRNYNRYYYISYRRMLSNYKGLTFPEIKEIFVKCAQLADIDDEVQSDFYGQGRPLIYRLMASKDYKEVVYWINKALPQTTDVYTKRTLLGMLVEASDSIHDNVTLLSALKAQNALLQERVDQQSEEAYSELQIRYDIDRLKSEKETLRMEKKETEVATSQRVIIVALIGVLVLAVVLMFLYRSNFSLKRRIRDTKEENLGLHRTIEELLGDSALKGTLDVRQNSYKDRKDDKKK